MCDWGFSPEYPSILKSKAVSFQIDVSCVAEIKQPNCQDYNFLTNQCEKCETGFSLSKSIIEEVVSVATPAVE